MRWDMCRRRAAVFVRLRAAVGGGVLASGARAVVAGGALLCLALPVVPRVAAAEDPVEILRRADRARGNLGGVTWEVHILSIEGDRTNELTASVQSRGYDFLSETLAPPKSKGQKLLMVSGNMWFHKPGLRKPISIAQRQRLMGQAAYGDIAATNYASEYDAAVVGPEAVDGEPCTVFDLAARTKNVTYDRIRYWISDARGVGVRAEYYTLSGKLLKTARMEFDRTVRADGQERPFISALIITDAVTSRNVTTLEFRDPRFTEIPDRVFNVATFGQ